MHIKAKDLVCIARSIPIHHSFYPQQFVPYTKMKNICPPVAKPKLGLCFDCEFGFHSLERFPIHTSAGSGIENFGFGFCILRKFGFGFHRVCKFWQSSGSGLPGFTSKVRVLGFIGFGFRFYKKSQI